MKRIAGVVHIDRFEFARAAGTAVQQVDIWSSRGFIPAYRPYANKEWYRLDDVQAFLGTSHIAERLTGCLVESA